MQRKRSDIIALTLGFGTAFLLAEILQLNRIPKILFHPPLYLPYQLGAWTSMILLRAFWKPTLSKWRSSLLHAMAVGFVGCTCGYVSVIIRMSASDGSLDRFSAFFSKPGEGAASLVSIAVLSLTWLTGAAGSMLTNLASLWLLSIKRPTQLGSGT